MPKIGAVTRKVTLWPLVGALYLMVAGGPFGLEDIVGSSGYAGAMLILLVTPLVWSLPTALMVSELSAAIPEEGGYYRWVSRGLGRFWGFQEAWMSLAGSIFDMAIGPTLFVSYLSRYYPAAQERPVAIGIGLVLIGGCAVWNMLGARVVGRTSLASAMVLLAPFAVLAVWAAAHPGQAPAASGGVHPDVLAGLMIAMWNYMGWDNSTTIAGEVVNPQRTYPRAMAIGVVLVAATYLIPIGAVAMTKLPASAWTTGSWPDVARSLWPGTAGAIVGVSIGVAGMLAALGTFNALAMAFSRLPAAMAEDGFLPVVFARRNAVDAPWVSILVCGCAWALCLGLSFPKLVMLDVLLTGLSILLEFASLIALRVREPNLSRPYRVPGGITGAALIGLPPLVLIVLAVVRNNAESVGPISALQLGGLILAAGVGCYFVARPSNC